MAHAEDGGVSGSEVMSPQAALRLIFALLEEGRTMKQVDPLERLVVTPEEMEKQTQEGILVKPSIPHSCCTCLLQRNMDDLTALHLWTRLADCKTLSEAKEQIDFELSVCRRKTHPDQ